MPFRTTPSPRSPSRSRSSRVPIGPPRSTPASLAARTRRRHLVWYVNVAAGAPLDELMTGRDGVLRPVSLPPGAATERALSALRQAP